MAHVVRISTSQYLAMRSATWRQSNSAPPFTSSPYRCTTKATFIVSSTSISLIQQFIEVELQHSLDLLWGEVPEAATLTRQELTSVGFISHDPMELLSDRSKVLFFDQDARLA